MELCMCPFLKAQCCADKCMLWIDENNFKGCSFAHNCAQLEEIRSNTSESFIYNKLIYEHMSD